MTRRELLAGAAGGFAPIQKRYKVGVIGHTGRGNYGHGLDVVWLEIPEAEVAGVADANEAGLAAAVKRLGGARGFGDYRQMLDAVKPDFVSVCPRWLDQHCDMVVACADRGVRGIYLEKPLCRTLEEADRMKEACARSGSKVAVAFQGRYSPRVAMVKRLIEEGRIGRVLEYRTRDKEDRRGGGEGLVVLAPHMFNLMCLFGGAPEWCLAKVLVGGRPAVRADVIEGAEGIGPLAGDEVHAMYRLSGGAAAYFDSVRDGAQGNPKFGLQIMGSRGMIQILDTGHLPAVRLLDDSGWVDVSSAGVGAAEPLKDGGLAAGNVLAVRDLIDAVERDRQPLASLEDARMAAEMVVGVFESHRTGAAARFPLEVRKNPLTLL